MEVCWFSSAGHLMDVLFLILVGKKCDNIMETTTSDLMLRY